MKYRVIGLARVFLNAIYTCMKKTTKTKTKIVYLSRQSNVTSLDMQLLSDEIAIQNPEMIQVFRLRKMEPGLLHLIKYAWEILVDMHHLAGAVIAVCDTYSIPVSFLKHKETLVIVQIWHAMGATKKFGLQSLGKKEGRSEEISRAMCMHKNYDYVVAPSRATAEFYKEAFGVTDSQIAIETLPHIDYVLDESTKKEAFVQQNPRVCGKKMVLYLPTFRSNEASIVKRLNNRFAGDEEWELVTSLHPLSDVENRQAYGYQGDFSVYDIMKFADIIITDYSACAYEASLLKVPVYFYVPDYTDYEDNRGLNIDLKREVPDYVFEDEGLLYQAIKSGNYEYDDLIRFQEKYIENTRNCTRRMAEFIMSARKRR